METSAKTAMNVNEIFLAIGEPSTSWYFSCEATNLHVSVAKKLPKSDPTQTGRPSRTQGGVDLQQEQGKPSGGCCK